MSGPPRKNIGPDWFNRFDVYQIQTIRQTSKVYMYTDGGQKTNLKKDFYHGFQFSINNGF